MAGSERVLLWGASFIILFLKIPFFNCHFQLFFFFTKKIMFFLSFGLRLTFATIQTKQTKPSSKSVVHNIDRTHEKKRLSNLFLHETHQLCLQLNLFPIFSLTNPVLLVQAQSHHFSFFLLFVLCFMFIYIYIFSINSGPFPLIILFNIIKHSFLINSPSHSLIFNNN